MGKKKKNNFKLRPYQKSDFKQYKKKSKKHQHILFGGATGYGKSAIIYNLVRNELKQNGRVIIVLPRRKLVRQISETLADFAPSIIMGSDTYYDENASVFVVSTPTMHNKLKTNKSKYFGNITKIIVDEAHINHMSTSMSLLNKYYWNKAAWCGLSATPIDEAGYRLEGYDYTMYEHQSQDLIALGYLTPIKVMVEDVPQGLDNISMTGGDYNESQLAEFMSDDARVNNVYSMWKQYCTERKTIVFAVNISHAEIIFNDFIKHGVKAGIVHSNINEEFEDITLEEFKHGNINVIINVGKLTTGFDEGSITAMIMARPTKSLRLWLQCIGRGIRLHKNKENCLLLDLAGTVAQHGYPTMRRDFNKVKPPKGEAGEVDFKETVCPHCDYSTQFRNCRKEVIETQHHVTRRTYCPNCDEIIKEDVKETKEIKRLKLVEDYTNTKKVTDEMVAEFIVMLQKNRDYKNAWTKYIGLAYNESKEFREALKILYNRYEAGLINIETATNNVMKIKETMKL